MRKKDLCDIDQLMTKAEHLEEPFFELDWGFRAGVSVVDGDVRAKNGHNEAYFRALM